MGTCLGTCRSSFIYIYAQIICTMNMRIARAVLARERYTEKHLVQSVFRVTLLLGVVEIKEVVEKIVTRTIPRISVSVY